MHVSVELFFDPESETRIQDVWALLGKLYGGPRATELGVRPHLSLTSFAAGEPTWLRTELVALAARFAHFPIDLVATESFPTTEGVVYLAPAPCRELEAIHQTFHDAIRRHGEDGHPYYRPGVWVPHCTVATDVPEPVLEDVVERARESLETSTVDVVAVGAVRYRPAQELFRVRLGPRSCGRWV